MPVSVPGVAREALLRAVQRSRTVSRFAVSASTLIWRSGKAVRYMATLNLIKDNRRGLLGAFVIMIIGMLLLGLGTAALEAGWINGFWWMTLTGLGSYLTYVPYNSVLFDRLIASTRVTGTAVFAIYLADSIGYTGSVGVQLYKDLAQGTVSRLAFFKGFTYAMSALGAVCLILACVYFMRKQSAAARAGAAAG